ncbi:MAG: zinc ribbon domain-containing protein [candidate division Zixibacteria bacterium]|nr:zinc ribbon domain-containing protein [candidate division Zixibacteria bacterium]
MPVYEYICTDCSNAFEELVSSSFKGSVGCPKCGSENSERQFSVFGFVSKSGGVTTASSSSGCSSCSSGHCGSCSCGH